MNQSRYDLPEILFIFFVLFTAGFIAKKAPPIFIYSAAVLAAVCLYSALIRKPK